MLRFFKTRAFVRAMKKSGVGDLVLLKAAEELARGLHDGELGGGVFKKRVAIPGKGKRGSVRAIVATKAGSRWFFLFAYRKNERASLTDRRWRR